jgi:hypothetical protein
MNEEKDNLQQTNVLPIKSIEENNYENHIVNTKNNLQQTNVLPIKSIEQNLNYNNNNNNNDIDPSLLLNNNVPSVEPDKSIVCWNCLSVLLVKPSWGIVQCPSCDKFNRVPNEEKVNDDKLILNKNKNHFEIAAPYVYAVMTCPYCQEENKVRKEAEHVVCFNCFNSFSIENPTIKTVSSNKPIKITNTNKVTRISDMYFPDPMYYPGKFPIDPIIINNNYNNMAAEKRNEELIGEIYKEIDKNKNNNNIRKNLTPKIDKYSAMRKFMKDMDEIEGIRNRKYNDYFKGINSNQNYYNNLNINNQYVQNNNNLIYQDSNNFLNQKNYLPQVQSNKNIYSNPLSYLNYNYKQNNINSKNNFINNMMFSNWNKSYTLK